ncbi:putative acid phosphatase SPBC4.06 [Cladobotryum mycophilum]|uniref:3-phytase n=1 Tax=Cladobotryum mycophilum TaxID=491253 RepID=A0ABR0SB56_9HYPO
MTTLQPRPEYTDAELAELYPPQLRLQQVQILLRHGERTPVNSRFTNAGLHPYWPYCSALGQLRASVLNPDAANRSFSKVEWKRRLETFAHDDAAVLAAGPAGELDAICDMGMLTDRGRETTYALGTRLRRLYVERLGFLPAQINDADPFYLRSTAVPRALESMQQAFQGLYPPYPVARLPPLTVISRSFAEETLFPNDGMCRRFAELSRAFAQRAAHRWNDSEEMAYLNEKLGKWMPDDSPRIAVDSRPRLIGILDTVNSTSAHGPATRLPKEFYDPKVKQIMEKIGVEEWYDGYRESNEYRTLGIGGLLADVVVRMVDSAELGSAHATAGQSGQAKSDATAGTIPTRFGLSGCHDTTLAGVLASLGAFDTDAWPPFTSHIAVELFRSANQSPKAASHPQRTWWSSIFGGNPSPRTTIGRKPTPDLGENEKKSLQGHFVRLRYNDTPVTIPGCKPQGKHLDGDESFCTLEAFKSIVDKFTPATGDNNAAPTSKRLRSPPSPNPRGIKQPILPLLFVR